MPIKVVLLLFVILLCHIIEAAGECANVETSEGLRTLQNGQAACAPLNAGETSDDKGKRFLTCSNGGVYIQSCSSGLRYHVGERTCTWPHLATCRFGDENPQASSTTVSKTVEVTLTQIITSASETNKSTAKPGQTSTISTTEPTRPAQPSGPCNHDTCRLPNCFCYGASPNMSISNTPMFIMLTFDDAVTVSLHNSFFKPLLVDNTYNLRNPNGCPITSAFYVNHDYTDYNLVKTLANRGNEIASHTISHNQPEGVSSTDYPEAVAEIAGMRDKVLQGTGNKTISDSMVGFRAPYLRVAHNVQFDALQNTGFLYDTSITNIEISSGRPPLWPFTLDYVMPRCTNLPCPTKPYPGLWEVPINGWVGDNGYGCSMIDVCTVGTNVFTASEEEWYNFYRNNFYRHFYPSRVPMHMFTHGSMFLRSPPSFPALVTFFQDLQRSHTDVWIVTPKMVIEWIKAPLKNSEMIANKWGC